MFGHEPLEMDPAPARRPASSAAANALRTAFQAGAGGSVAAVWSENVTAILVFLLHKVVSLEIQPNVDAIVGATVPVVLTMLVAIGLAWAGSAARDREFSTEGPTPIASVVGKVV